MFTKSSIYLAVATLVLLASTAVQAGERYNPIQVQNVTKECGACHMPYQPQMLPKKSWRRIMGGLSDHFGEDASLNAKMTASIEKFYVDNAANSGWGGGRFMRGLTDASAPLRITATPYWIRRHNFSEKTWKDPRVKTKSNCLACHQEARRGSYEDD